MNKEQLTKLKNHLMTGVSYMIPFVVAGGLCLALNTVLGEFGIKAKWLSELGNLGYSMIVPVLAGYLAYSIADKPGIGPGFLAGLVARKQNAGFIGGILAGFLAGWVVAQLKKVPFHPYIEELKPMMFIPLGGTVIAGGIMMIIGVPLGAMQQGLNSFLEGLTGANAAVLGGILGAMLAFDMGGPLNKAALTFVIGMFGEGVYEPNAAAFAGIMIPPLSMFVATRLAPHKFTEVEYENGIPALCTGAVGFTETAIPFAVADPLSVIPAITTGGAVGGAMMMGFGVEANIPGGGFLSIPLFPHSSLLAVLSIVVGTLVATGLVIFLKDEPDPEAEDQFEGLDLEGSS